MSNESIKATFIAADWAARCGLVAPEFARVGAVVGLPLRPYWTPIEAATRIGGTITTTYRTRPYKCTSVDADECGAPRSCIFHEIIMSDAPLPASCFFATSALASTVLGDLDAAGFVNVSTTGFGNYAIAVRLPDIPRVITTPPYAHPDERYSLDTAIFVTLSSSP